MKSAITALALIASCASAQPYVETMNVGEPSENLAVNSEEAVEHYLDLQQAVGPGSQRQTIFCCLQWQQP